MTKEGFGEEKQDFFLILNENLPEIGNIIVLSYGIPFKFKKRLNKPFLYPIIDRLKVFQLLLKYNADINNVNDLEETTLFYVARYGGKYKQHIHFYWITVELLCCIAKRQIILQIIIREILFS